MHVPEASLVFVEAVTDTAEHVEVEDERVAAPRPSVPDLEEGLAPFAQVDTLPTHTEKEEETQEVPADDFGDFGDFEASSNQAEESTAPLAAEEHGGGAQATEDEFAAFDDFGDFGDFEAPPGEETGETEQEIAQTEAVGADDDDGFGDFGDFEDFTAAPAVDTVMGPEDTDAVDPQGRPSGETTANEDEEEKDGDFGDFGGFEQASLDMTETAASVVTGAEQKADAEVEPYFEREAAAESLSFEEKELLRLGAAPLEVIMRDLRRWRAVTSQMLGVPSLSREDKSESCVHVYRQELMESAGATSLKSKDKPLSQALLLTSPWSIQQVTHAIVSALPPDALPESQIEEDTVRMRTRTRSSGGATSPVSLGERGDLGGSFDNSGPIGSDKEGNLALELDFAKAVGTTGSEASEKESVEEVKEREMLALPATGLTPPFEGAGGGDASSSTVEQFVQGLPDLRFMVSG